MMMCLKDLLLYVVLLPIPAASPLLIGLYWLAVILSIRPCGYCIALFIIIYLTTSPSSPFLTIPTPQLPINPLKPLTSPIPDRSWLTWNDGAWWDPAIVGYSEIANIYHAASAELANQTTPLEAVPPKQEVASASDISAAHSWWSRIPWRQSAVSDTSTPSASPPTPSPSASAETLETLSEDAPPLPTKYLDLRWAGIGFVLDIGLSRSEEGMGWELADAKRAATAPEPIYRASDFTTAGDGSQGSRQGGAQANAKGRTGGGMDSAGGGTGRGQPGRWGSLSFLGSW